MTQKNISCCYAQFSDGTSALELSPVRFRVIEGGAGKATRSATRRSTEPVSQGIPTMDFKKILAFVIVCVILLCCASALTDALAAGNRDAQLSSVETAVVYVRPGETLWSIASDHSVDGCSTKDVVSYIERSNGIDGGYLQPGQALVVPA